MSASQFVRSGLAAALGTLLGASFTLTASAQSVTTTPVGAVTLDLVQGYTMVGIPLIEPAILTSTPSANTDSIVTLSGVSNAGALLSPDGLYYAEVIAGPLEGERFDVDTPATIALSNNSVAINTSSSNNTYALTANALDSCSVSVRQHVTLERIASLVSPSFIGNNSVSSADQVLIYDSQTSALQTFYLRSDNTTWRKSGSSESVGKTTIIPPGIGFFIRKNSSTAKLTHVGDVRANDFAIPMTTGLQLFAYPFPTSVSPTNLGGSSTNGWSGNNSVSLADQIIVFNSAAGSYDTYFLRADGSTWRKSGSSEDVKDTQIINHGAGFWLKKSTADTNYILNLPYEL